MQSKRPPNLSLQIAKRPVTRTIIELQTPVDNVDEEDGYHSSSSSGSSASQPNYALDGHRDHDFDSEDLSEDLAVLDQLRRNVHKNLRLRPLRSASGTVRTQQTQRPPLSSSQPSDMPLNVVTDLPQQRSPSPDSAFSPASAYYTPLTEFRATPLSAFHHSRYPSVDVATRNSQPQATQSAPAPSHGTGTSPALLLARLSAPTRPLLIDTRPVQSFTNSHLKGSVNVAIPSLILKRSRKPAGAFQTLDALRQFITTEGGKRHWDELLSGHDWDGDVIVFDETMSEKDRDASQATAWSIIDVVAPLLSHGGVDFLEGGFAAARQHPYMSQLLLSSSSSEERGQDSSTDDEKTPPLANATGAKKPPGGLFQLDTTSALRSKVLPEIERPAPSPRPVMPSAIQSWNIIDDYSSPSPAPSSTVFSRPQPPRRPSIPTLRRIDTDRPSTSLHKLQVPRMPPRANTLAAPPVNGVGESIRHRSRSPSHLNLLQSNHSPPPSARLLSVGPITPSRDHLSPPSPNMGSVPLTPRSPRTPQPFSPPTPRPDFDQPPSTEEPYPEFTISTILPNFLYLGPELTSEGQVESLLSLGVRRIVNIAAECDDDHGLRLRDRFERYVHIPMRDNIEEDNITRGVREVCAILDDARLHSSPTYVHCKAGKSRSVTAVMAYLIHANHWTLSQAYTFVLERRKGISPNIGFVSELMTFEEQELGGKSVGVVKMSPQETEGESQSAGGAAMAPNYQVALGGRRPPHLRESLPPAFTSQHSFTLVPTLGHGDVAQLGDSQQELEIKDSEGRYRHARRAPVDEATLQPLRRVSKAGLESAINI
ncbi:hypothetical protein NM688_g1674 [Phlebia brevispora]|uniref:Uncharacterized protein n=1 Tax=Phlebia brevispora TaxID=194682 RepID=A0ACC1TB49_9APHY|nr:hypothetical protein NM688_g1674 [Phlebia brevispora]